MLPVDRGQQDQNLPECRISKGGIAKIVIERTLNKLIVTIHIRSPASSS